MFPWTGLDHQGENVGSIQDGSHIAVADCLGEVTGFWELLPQLLSPPLLKKAERTSLRREVGD